MSDAIILRGALPDDVPELYDVVVIGGIASPGIATVESSRGHEWDEKKGKGSSGATQTYQGKAIAKITVKLRLWRDYELGVDHFDEYLNNFLPLLHDVTRDSKPQAVDIYHPYLAPLGITSCVVEDIGTPKPNGQGVREVEIKLREFRKPQPAGGTPGGSKGGKAEEKKGGNTLEYLTFPEKAGRAARDALDDFLDLLA